MQKHPRLLAIAFFALIASITVPAQAQAEQTLTVIAEDSFDYTGNLVGKNGGTGFTTAWSYGSGSSNYGVSTPTLTYTGITSSGGFVDGCSVLNGQLCAATRDIPIQSSGKVFVQMIVNFGSQSGGGTPNLRFYDESDFTGGIGANGGTYGSKISILGTGLAPKDDGTSSAGTLNGQGFLILGIDYSQNSTSLWLNPDMSTFSYFTTPAPSASYAGLAPKIKTLNFNSRFSNLKFDELKILKVTGLTASEEAAIDEASRIELQRKRDAETIAARTATINKLITKTSIKVSELSAGGFPLKKIESLQSAYTEAFQVNQLAISVLTDNERYTLLSPKIMKYVQIEKITGIADGICTARDLVIYGLIPADTPQKTRIISALSSLPVELRDTIEKANIFITTNVAIVNDRRDRLAARLAE
jgi:hypothetical protein